jgi:uncharacterized delta-60 repeat protein
MTGPARPRLEHLEPRETPAAVGTLDPTFGTGGRATFNLGGSDVAFDAVADRAGRVVVAGFTPGAGGSDFLVERVNTDGTLDTTFGTGGKTTIDFAGADDKAASVSLDPAGNILVAGVSTPGGGDDQAAIVRLTPAGVIDGMFGTGGKITVSVAGTDVVGKTAFADATGGIVVAATVSSAGSSAFAVARLTTTGAFDGTFGTGGKTSVNFGPGSFDELNSATRDGAGNIVLVGTSTLGGVSRFAVARLRDNGVLDAGFGALGKTTFNLGTGTNDFGSAVAVDAAGRPVVVGRSVAGGVPQIGIARLMNNGTPDATFGTGGFVRMGAGGAFSLAMDVLFQPGGKVVVGGVTGNLGTADFAVVRLNADGAPDTTFNSAGPTSGTVAIDFGGSDGLIALTPSVAGRIVGVGYESAPPFGVRVARLIGTVEAGRTLVVSGPETGAAAVYFPSSPGAYVTPPSQTLSPFGPITASVRAAVADVNGDGVQDTILVTGPGAAVRFAVVDGRDGKTLLVPSTDPFGSPGFTAGAFVAAGDIDGDGRAEWAITPDQGGGPNVVIYGLHADGTLADAKAFFALGNPGFRGGARVAMGDLNADGTPDLAVGAGFLGGPAVEVHDGKALAAGNYDAAGSLIGSGFFAFPGSDAETLRNGVFLAVGDLNGDGFADLVAGGGPGGGPRVLVLGGQLLAAGNVEGAYGAPVANFFFGDGADRGGVRVAAVDADFDGLADLAVGSGEGLPSRVRVYLGKSFTSTAEPATFQDLDPYNQALPGGVFVG